MVGAHLSALQKSVKIMSIYIGMVTKQIIEGWFSELSAYLILAKSAAPYYATTLASLLDES